MTVRSRVTVSMPEGPRTDAQPSREEIRSLVDEPDAIEPVLPAHELALGVIAEGSVIEAFFRVPAA